MPMEEPREGVLGGLETFNSSGAVYEFKGAAKNWVECLKMIQGKKSVFKFPILLGGTKLEDGQIKKGEPKLTFL
jgi:hypothetical protein